MRFSVVVPIRNTDHEYNFMLKTLPSAFKLEPDEVIIGLDKDSDRIIKRAYMLAEQYHYKGRLRCIEVCKDPSWNFHLAHVTWQMYNNTRNDVILHYDIDNILLPRVLKGLKYIGRDNIAVVSFTKRFLIRNLADLIRYTSYRIRVRISDFVFAGLYYIYKPYFFNIIKLDEYMNIRNGIDTYLVNKLLSNTKYKIITLKDIGCRCLTYQNEDYPWRQFQLGLWYGANMDIITDKRLATYEFRRLQGLRNGRYKGLRGKLARIYLKFITNPNNYIFLYCLAYQRWHALYGFRFAQNNPEHPMVKKARELDIYEWGMLGSEFLHNLPKELQDRYKPKEMEVTGYA